MSQIISVKVLDSYGNGKIGSVIDGANWIINNKDIYNIKVANISFGTTPNSNVDIENTIRLIKHIENMWHNGIVVVAAAGNNGPCAKSITAPGTSHIIITVGSMDDKTFHSGRGPTTDGFQNQNLLSLVLTSQHAVTEKWIFHKKWNIHVSTYSQRSYCTSSHQS